MSVTSVLTKVLPAIGLPTLPGFGLIPTWLLEDGFKKLADYGTHWIEDPAHLIVFKEHVRDHIMTQLKERAGGSPWVSDIEDVLNAILGIAPAATAKVVGTAQDVQVLPGSIPVPPPTPTPTPAPVVAPEATQAPSTAKP